MGSRRGGVLIIAECDEIYKMSKLLDKLLIFMSHLGPFPLERCLRRHDSLVQAVETALQGGAGRRPRPSATVVAALLATGHINVENAQQG